MPRIPQVRTPDKTANLKVVEIKRIWNFIHTSATDEDIRVLFGEFKDGVDSVHRFDNTWDMTAIALFCKMFKSRTKAKEAGWRGPIEVGLRKYIGAKDDERIFIYKPNIANETPVISDLMKPGNPNPTSVSNNPNKLVDTNSDKIVEESQGVLATLRRVFHPENVTPNVASATSSTEILDKKEENKDEDEGEGRPLSEEDWV